MKRYIEGASNDNIQINDNIYFFHSVYSYIYLKHTEYADVGKDKQFNNNLKKINGDMFKLLT